MATQASILAWEISGTGKPGSYSHRGSGVEEGGAEGGRVLQKSQR